MQQIEITLPRRVDWLLESAVFARETSRRLFRQMIRLATMLGVSMGVDRETIEIAIGLKLARQARKHAENVPLRVSYRNYLLGAAILSRSGRWFSGYNKKPFEDTDDESNGRVPKNRNCAEMTCMDEANAAHDVNAHLIVLYGEHHDKPQELSPLPCPSCKRYFTYVPHHRNIVVISCNMHTDTVSRYNLGDLIDEAHLEQVECECCHDRNGTNGGTDHA